MMKQMRRRFAWTILSLLLFQAAAPAASGVSMSMSGRSAAGARTCVCCCTGGSICLCQKRHGQTGASSVNESQTMPCRSHCRSSQPSMPALGVPAVLLPAFAVAPTLTIVGLSIRRLSTFSAVVLPVPAPPPRETPSQM